MNAKAECIRCESLNTYYKDNNHVCNDCGYIHKIETTKKALRLIAGFIVIVLTFIIL